MKTLGLVVEYNPFHNGHLYHINASKEKTGADAVICVMSGNFVQRGEPAVMDKWARTQIALKSGIDLVVELPFVFASASAEYFAYGAVKILDSLGIVDCICFGSESGNIRELEEVASVLSDEPANYKSALKRYLNEGLSFPESREKALYDFFSEKYGNSLNIEKIISTSNNILGIEYIKAIKRLKSSIIPLTISRKGGRYTDRHLTGSFSSATAIRKCIFDSSFDEAQNLLEKTMPPASLEILREEIFLGRCPVSLERFENIIFAYLRKMSKEDIAALPYVSEGMENRIKEAADGSGSLEELLENIDTRRYTRTRIQRCLVNMLGGLTSQELDRFMESGGPRYIRVLGFNEKGRQLLSEVKKHASLPVIVKTADFKRTEDPLLNRMLEIESVATDVYVLGYSNPEFRKAGQEFTRNIVRVNT